MALTIALSGMISYFVFYCHERFSVFRFHALSHTAASLLIAGGADAATVSGLLGHSQVSTTLDIYTHAFDDKKKAASAVLQESLDI